MKTHLSEKTHICDVCQKSFLRKSHLRRHLLTHKNDDVRLLPVLQCEECGKSFSRKDNLLQHSHEKPQLSCIECDKVFHRNVELNAHRRTQHPRASIVSVKRKMHFPSEKSKRVKHQPEGFGVFKTMMFYPEESDGKDFKVFQTRIQPEIQESLQQEISEKGALKWYMVMKAILERTTSDEGFEEIETYFRNPCITELVEDTIPKHIEEGYAKIVQSFEEFTQRGSGWTLKKIQYLELKSAKYHPLAASSYIPLPKKLSAKKAVLNIQNQDQKCLVWCLLAHKLNIHWKNNPHRVSYYVSYEKEINLGDIECPVPLSKISLIEKLNQLRINVFGYEDDEVCPLYISPKEDPEVINLLLIADDEKQHYCLIRNFSRLLGNLTKYNGETFYCYRCLHRFMRKDLLQEHMKYCKEQTVQAIKMPKQGDNVLQFTGLHYQHPVPYTIYADFESLLVPISTTSPSPQTSFSEKTAYHIPCGYAYVIVGPNGNSFKPIQVYRGENAVDHFLEAILHEKEELGRKLLEIKPMKLTADQEREFQEVETCKLCDKPLRQNRVRDHCHITGSYRGALHAECNLNFKLSKTIPVIFHNLKNYDGHHLMTKLGKYKEYEIDVIASTMENYITFKLRKQRCPIQLVFLDSFQFLPTSLEKLVKNLQPEQFKILEENFPQDTPLSMLTRKGIYPYDYFSSMEKFEETQLPPPSAFYNSLLEEEISEDDYQHAKNIWETFKMKNLGEYHDLYVKTDVLLLADVFQNFRKLCQHYYDIDCARLFTAPGLAWQACLKMSDQPLELLTDIDMLLFIERGIRGGTSMISKRYAKANNKYMKNYDPSIQDSYIMYWDANNLYGWAMSQHLPHGGFEWIDGSLFTEEDILSLQDDSDYGYIFEVDLEYPKHLHDSHNDYPLAPERLIVTEDVLSPYAKTLLKRNKFTGTAKLVPNLNNKSHYVIHYRNLKLYLQLGLKLISIHKTLKFRQSPWLKKYIEFNTEKRKLATSTFEKDFFKLLNNSVYGKTLENLRKRRQIELCNTEKRCKKLVASPTFHSFKTYNEDLTAVERLKSSILMNRPIYVGFSILELSKLLMYNFHFNFIKKNFKQAQLLFTDTDSLTYLITSPDIYQDMKQHKEEFDFSDYPRNHPLYCEDNKKVLGKFKDELNGEIALEFIGLKAKMYSLKTEKDEKKRAKGVSTQVVRRKIKHENYVECLQASKTSIEKQIRIAQDNHQLYTMTQNKISLSPFDDKRYILEDGINSLAYGHHKIKEDLEME